MERLMDHLCCRVKLTREIAKYAACTIIPQALLISGLLWVSTVHPSSFEGELEKYIFMVFIVALIVGHILGLIHYSRRIFKRYRARRQISFIDLQADRMWPPVRPIFVDEDTSVRFLPNEQVIYVP